MKGVKWEKGHSGRRNMKEKGREGGLTEDGVKEGEEDENDRDHKREKD